MDPEIKRLLEETKALAKDNHQMLRAIRRHQWYGLLTTVVFWLVILIAPLYLYQQYLQPFISKFSATTGVSTSGPFGLPTSADVQKLINSFKAGQ
ncbi:MAG: hypothetical protein NUV60_01835 [Patescibacteria group bacterium]|nr:hypothetical protein [Patescibacteria group bacterium]